MDSNTICAVTNRSGGFVAYSIPDRHIRREFSPHETKRVPYYEIEEVSAQPGGRELIYNYLYVDDKVLKEGLNIQPEREYYLKEADVDKWMSTCSLDEFKDALDFAPEGVKDLIKSHAVSLPLNDVSKCEALKEQLGFDCMAAIKNEKDTVAPDVVHDTDGNTKTVAAPTIVTGRRSRVTTIKTGK